MMLNSQVIKLWPKNKKKKTKKEGYLEGNFQIFPFTRLTKH